VRIFSDAAIEEALLPSEGFGVRPLSSPRAGEVFNSASKKSGEEKPSQNPRPAGAAPVFGSVACAESLPDLLAELEAAREEHGHLPEAAIEAGVHRLCQLLGREEVRHRRWSALTLEKAHLGGGIQGAAAEGARAAELLAAEAAEQAARLTPAALAVAVEGLAAAGLYEAPLLRAAEAPLALHVGELDRELLAALVVTWAEAGLRPTHSFLEAVAAAAMGKLLGSRPDTLTGILLGYAKLNFCHDGLLDATAKAVMASSEAFSPTQLSYVLWSYAVLGVPFPRLFDHVTNSLLPHIDASNAHPLTICCWSFSAVRHYDSMTGVLLDAVAEVLISDTDAFDPKDISRLMWTFAELGHPHHRMVEAVHQWARGKFERFDSRGLSNLVWGAAKTDEALNATMEQVLAGVGIQASRTIASFSSMDMANLLWGFAHMRYYHLPLFCAIEEHTHKHLVDLGPKHLSRLISSFAALNHRPSSVLLEELSFFVAFNLKKMDAPSAVRAVWGIGVLGALSDELYSKFCDHASGMQARDLEVCHQVKLVEIELMAKLMAKQGGAPPRLLPDNVRAEALETMQESALYTSNLLTSLQKEVMITLISMGVPYRGEAMTADRCLKVDLAFSYKGHQIALEASERQMYSANAPYHPMGKKLLKRRLLEADGWKVIDISSHEWELLHTREARRRYLQRRLELAVSPPGTQLEEAAEPLEAEAEAQGQWGSWRLW